MKTKLSKESLVAIALVGGAVVLLVKSGKIKLPTLANLPAKFTKWTPFAPVDGTQYNPADPAAFVSTDELINGTVSGFYSGDTSSYRTPTINEITSDVLADTYHAAVPGSVSVVRNPGAYW